MIHEENERDWEINDIIIHDADAKKPYMLMIILKKRKNGMIGTRYIYPGLIWNKHIDVPYSEMPVRMQRHYGKMCWNGKEYLHDPSRFEIEVPKLGDIAKYWNRIPERGFPNHSFVEFGTVDEKGVQSNERKSEAIRHGR